MWLSMTSTRHERSVIASSLYISNKTQESYYPGQSSQLVWYSSPPEAFHFLTTTAEWIWCLHYITCTVFTCPHYSQNISSTTISWTKKGKGSKYTGKLPLAGSPSSFTSNWVGKILLLLLWWKTLILEWSIHQHLKYLHQMDCSGSIR